MKQVSVSNFYVSYNDTEILKDISFDLLAGEVTGLLARNGEGKTTLLNSIAGLKDYEGSISVFGKSPNLYDRDFKKKLAYIQDEPNLLEYFTAKQYLEFIERIEEIKLDRQLIDYYIGNYNLDDVYDNLIIKNYSFGMKKKIQLISQFILNKNFIIIDEPTNGLDIETIAKLKKEIKIYNSNNDKVILIASHNVGFIESVCSQAIILNKGRIGNYISINDDTKLEEIYLYTVRNNE